MIQFSEAQIQAVEELLSHLITLQASVIPVVDVGTSAKRFVANPHEVLPDSAQLTWAQFVAKLGARLTEANESYETAKAAALAHFQTMSGIS